MNYEILVQSMPDIPGVVAMQVNQVTGSERETLMCQMINTLDPNVVRELRKLGWAPPGYQTELEVAARQLVERLQRGGSVFDCAMQRLEVERILNKE